ncbi:hypothetical protein [Streptomyces sp. NPDC056463]|uniref:hypothetical protein n=1 Tax=Streptomyces sp. NPDC056463 TaxID=3345827 RepID=UPI003681520B
MSTDAHRPTSRISEALFPPPKPAPDTAPMGVPGPAAPDRAPAARPETAAPAATTVAGPPPGIPPRPTEPPAPARPATPPARPAPARPATPPARPAPEAPAPPARAVTPAPARLAPKAPAPPAVDGATGSARPGVPAPARPASAPPAPVRPASAPPAPVRPASAPAHPGVPAPTPAPPASAPARPASAPTAPARPEGPVRSADAPAVETTARLRPVRDTGTRSIPPRPAAPAPAPARPTAPAPRMPAQTYGTYGAYRPYTAPPETVVETTTRLRPIRERRVGRFVAAGACLVLGVGLVGGAAAGAVLAATEAGAAEEPAGYAEARTVWHSVPVDTLFPRTLAGPKEGPGAADRTWTRIVVAPDAPCTAAALPKSVLTTLQPVGCDRVLRATYTDATASSVITVGLVFTQADPTATRSLATESAARLGADVPPALSAPGTVAARFGAAQRAGWWTRALADLPVVVTAVSGFADGRPVASPQPADRAMAEGQTSPVAQSGLGHEAKGVADRIESTLRTTVTTAAKDDDR